MPGRAVQGDVLHPHSHGEIVYGIPSSRRQAGPASGRTPFRSYRAFMRNERHGERLSEEELELFLQYLHRFANHDLDLFALMQVGDPEHPAFVSFSREPEAGVARSAYRRP